MRIPRLPCITEFLMLLLLTTSAVASAARPRESQPSLAGLRLGLVVVVDDNLYHSHEGATVIGNHGPRPRMPIAAAEAATAEATRILEAAGVVVVRLAPSDLLRGPFREHSQRKARKALAHSRPALQALMRQQELDELLVLGSPLEADSIFYGVATDNSAQGVFTLNSWGRDRIAPYALLMGDRISAEAKVLHRSDSGDCARGVFEKLPKGVDGAKLPDTEILPLRDAVLDHVRMATFKVLHSLKLTQQKPRCSAWHG